MNNNPFEEIFGPMGLDKSKVEKVIKSTYYCAKCKNVMTQLMATGQKTFYCPSKKCTHFGMVTVVAIKK